MRPRRDEMYDKYRVFREPEDANEHPVGMTAKYMVFSDDPGEMPVEREAEEVDGYYFVLRPAKDPHALRALRAYAASCEYTHPRLHSDLVQIIDDIDLGDEISGTEF